jgi:hypothetical protein
MREEQKMISYSGIVIIMCTDISIYTQHTACDRFVVWLLVSNSYLGHHQANYTKTKIYTENT